ncbi:MAG: septum formation initiator family protein [Actinomycetota bacterium]|nr:septum formation initiator family protein [Actinomycetota bacterium]
MRTPALGRSGGGRDPAVDEGSSWGIGPGVIVLLLILGLALSMAIGPTRQLLAQRRQIAAAADALRRLEASTAHYEDQIERLKDPDYLEAKAREQMGLIRPGERSYIVVPPPEPKKKKKEERASGASDGGLAETTAPGFVGGLLRFIGIG